MLRAEVMANYLYVEQQESVWTTNTLVEGVILKQARNSWVLCPPELSRIPDSLFDAVARLNVRVWSVFGRTGLVANIFEQVAMTVKTSMINTILRDDSTPFFLLSNGLRLQILPDISSLPSCQKHHFAAFIQSPGYMVVWDDDPTKIVARAKSIEQQIAATFMALLRNNKEKSEPDQEKHVMVSEQEVDNSTMEAAEETPRRIVLIHSIISGITLALLFSAIGGGWRQIAIETMIDKTVIRLALVVVVPLQLWLGLFFMQSIVVCFAEMVGPTSQTDNNSKFYSGKAPPRGRLSTEPLPHVTIQCPVYKESLHSVIMPTIQSLKVAIGTYEMQGGTANIFINDDGMQLLTEQAAQFRRDYYEENHIGWVARPKHNPNPQDGEPAFVRAGRFKKASNMNHGLAISVRVEEKLAELQRVNEWKDGDEAVAYEECLRAVLSEDEVRTWAEGNTRIGDYILIVDCDTRVPHDCLLDAVTEMEQSPSVAVIQFPSGVLNITNRYLENGIAFFTSLIYTIISFIVACGDIPPFVGHNALLRWSALQDVSLQEEVTTLDGGKMLIEKYWSEHTVSEDFELALRLQIAGYTIRLAAYNNTDFKEGVSLTVYDELARWKKYAYGCSEIIFHPLRYWLIRGPFTPLFRTFVRSSIPLPSKLSIIAYIGTYYAIGSAYLLITANYFLVGWYPDRLDHYYIDSFKIFFSIVVVFSGLGNIALAVLRYRLNEKGLMASLGENSKWIVLLYVFFGGISMHVSEAILSHLFSVDMTWGATAKEVEDTTFFVEMAKLLRKFKIMFAFCALVVGGMVYLGLFAPMVWRITQFTAIFPLSAVVFTHVMLPVALNPSLMLFTW